MDARDFLEQTTKENFNEQAYFLGNQDVQQLIQQGDYADAQAHFETRGHQEQRWQLNLELIQQLKAQKIAKIRPFLTQEQTLSHYLEGIPGVTPACFYNFLDAETIENFDLIDTENISQNPYDAIALKLIEHYQDGLILDFGAGFRRFNYPNVINYEIVKYVSTDVVGVGEKLPFKDGVFDCIFSFAVLEHVKDPFACAHEIMRCLKPGGMAYIVVPHLQPYHGYPHHYYNMTHQGLANLFSGLDIQHQEVNGGNTVIWSIAWMLRSWILSLPPQSQQTLLELRVADLIQPTPDFRQEYEYLLRQIPPEIHLEIAAATSLLASKKSEKTDDEQFHPIFSKIVDVLRPQYLSSILRERYNIEIPEFKIKAPKLATLEPKESKPEATEPKASESQPSEPKSKSRLAKTEHILRTTLHYWRLWKKDVLKFD